MIYITGEKDTLDDLKKIDEYTGADFEAQFFKLNPHIPRARKVIPPYTPILLVGQEPHPPELRGFVCVLAQFTLEERKRLYHLQKSEIDIPSLVAMDEIMKEFQVYMESFRKYYDSPLISTPWGNSSPGLNNNSVLDIFGNVSGAVAGTVRRMRHVIPIDELYEAMSKKEAINLEIVNLSRDGRGKHFAKIQMLEKEAKAQTRIIKQLLPKRQDAALTQYLNAKGVDVQKLRTASHARKMAAKGKPHALSLDLLNKSGLERAKRVIKGLITVGETVEKASMALGVGIVAYDTYQAYQQKQDYMKTFFSGATGFGVSLGLAAMGTAELGACTIGSLGGVGIGGGLALLSSPLIGTIVCIVAGIAAISYVGYQVSQLVEYAWDSEIGTELRHDISTFASDMQKKLESAWKSGSDWVLSFYNGESKTQVAH